MGTKEDSVGDDGTQLSRPLFLKSSTTLYSRRKVQIREPSDGGFFNAGLGAAGATSAAETLIKSVHPTKQEEPTFQSSQEKQKKIGFFAMFHYSTYHERALMVVGIIMASISGLSMPIWLMLLGESLEMFNQIGQIIASGGSITILLDQMYALIYSFAIVGAVALVTGTTYVAMWTYVGEMQALRIRQAFVKSALRQEAAWFDTHGTGDPQELPILATNALTHIQTALGRSIGDTFANLLSALGCLMVALALDAPLALFMLCILPVIAIAVGIISCFMRKSSGRALTEFSKCGAFASEILTGIKTIASLRAEKWAVQRYSGHAMSAQKFSIRAQIYSKLAAGVMGSLFYVTYTFAFIFGTYQAAQRAETEASYKSPFACYFRECGIHGSSVMVCIYGVVLCAQFVALMNPGLNDINLGRTSAAEIYSAIERTPTIDGTDNAKGVQLGSGYDGSIQIKNLVFAYPSRPMDIIFSNFNLDIKAGTSVALVGPSGSGKSSLSKLLLRLYDPIQGQILVGGIPLTETNLKSWRQNIGYVSQEPSLFPGTIFDNIASGKFDGIASTEEVKAAAVSASCDDFISDLPDGYNTFYSGSSIQLSGGQIQRICIARALIRNPKVLLLDEATSALDTQSERVVQDALDKIRATRSLTTITVAHRLTTILHSDKIVVIAEGSIQEVGTHKELVEEGGIYATLCEGQGLTADAGDDVEEEAALSPVSMSVSPTNIASITKSIHSSTREDIEKGLTNEDDKDDGPIDIKGVSSRIREYSKAEIGFTFLGCFGGMIVGVLPACEAILFGLITGNFFLIEDAQEMRDTNYALSLWFLVLAFASLGGNMAMGIGLGVSGSRLVSKMRVMVFDNLLRYPMGWFDFPEHSSGELTTILEEDSEAISNVTGFAQGLRIQVFSCLVAGMAVALGFSWQIGLIAIACIPLILGAGLLQAKCGKRETPDLNEVRSVSASTLLERAFHDIVVLQAYGLNDAVSSQYAAALAPDFESKKRQGFYNGLSFGFAQFAVFSTFAVIFYAGIELMLSMKVEFTDFFIALLAVMFSTFGAGQTGADFSARKKGLEAAARLFELADSSTANQDDPLSDNGSKPTTLEGRVKFKNAIFAYPSRPDAKIFYCKGDRDGFSLDINSRQSVAFTGRSGCGKSTALQILLRFYRIDHGSVELDNEELTDLNLGWLRDQIGYVGQMPVLFQGSVRDNIKLGKPNATEQEIVDAAKSANCHEFVTEQLSQGYETDIGVGGSLLSGGQRQRIAIARAIVKNPKILVLDEATAALDNESEKIVQAALDKMQEVNPRTTLVVAHRLETVKNCDKIVVLDRGGVKEEGSHSDLMDLKGLYHTLWKKQGGGH